MQVFLDDDRIEDIEVSQGTVEDILQVVQNGRCPAGRTIIGLRCDGIQISGERMSLTLAQGVAEIGTLELYTGTKPEIVVDAMREARAALDATDEHRSVIADTLAQGQTQEAVAKLGECLVVWKQVHDALTKSILMLGLQEDDLVVEGVPLASAFDRPKQLLAQVKEALVAQDFVLLGDILQHEFGEVCDQWRAVITHLERFATEQEDRLGVKSI